MSDIMLVVVLVLGIKFVRGIAPQHPPRFRGIFKLKFSRVYHEPDRLNWHGALDFSWLRFLRALFGLFFLTLAYIVLILPSSYVYVQYASVPGYTVSNMTDYLMGVIPAIGSTHIIRAADRYWEWVGYSSQRSRNRLFMPFTFFFVILLMVGMFYITAITTYGKTLDAAFEGEAMDFSGILADEIWQM